MRVAVAGEGMRPPAWAITKPIQVWLVLKC